MDDKSNLVNLYREKFSSEPFLVNKEGQVFFVNDYIDVGAENKIKRFLKKYPFIFNIARFIFSPVLQHFSYTSNKFIKELSEDSLILNIGSGSSKLSEKIMNVDISPFDNVHVVASAEDLPFLDSSVDGIVAEVLLEHVENVDKVVSEFYRVLKPGGKVYITTPFLYPFHAVPGDYRRWTKSGLKVLFKDFQTEKIEVYSGSITTVVLSVAYFLALPASFFGNTIYEYCVYFFLAILFPFKFIDPIFRKFPGAHYSASSFVATFSK